MKIYGHTKQLEFLNHLLKNDVFHHAFLFVGPELLGKRLIAESFAQSLVLNKELSLDYKKDSNAWTDILLVESEKEIKKGVEVIKDISIKQIRELKKQITLTHEGNKRVVIIDNFHKSSISAQNSLLKLLEEPKENTIIILVASDISRILPTIISRVVRINFNLLTKKELQIFNDKIEERYIEIALGRPELLKKFIKDTDFAQKYLKSLETLKNLKKMSLSEKINLADELSKDFYLTNITLMLWSSTIRDIAISKKHYKLLTLSDKIDNALFDIKFSNVNKRLRLENLLLKL